MTKHHPNVDAPATPDYIPAAGVDFMLPAYDLMTRLFGIDTAHGTLLSQAATSKPADLLEIGCGTGSLTVRAKREFPQAQVVGFDPDPRALQRARRKAGGLTGIRFDSGYAQQLPYPDQSFDVVLSAFMLHHLSAEARSATATEVLRVLRPGGTLNLVDFGGAMVPQDGLMARVLLRNGHVAPNLGDGIPRLLQAAGFDCAEVATQRTHRAGRCTFYRAVRPA
ncbi:class I SAM-dependent methyltransferase [Nocardia stercoris]|uniref:Class I SAM-dependent methyltransferase n=1 Tax=Nocardia stercoris TaxID=2483361 RepID=A0A3M2LAR0_9NOCA|nr:class I SAM-dependent methyltransferase [Nocardia stercoris]RMI33025.1 class I SAM-dependent methyltransferase [Nocardia stercoris]